MRKARVTALLLCLTALFGGLIEASAAAKLVAEKKFTVKARQDSSPGFLGGVSPLASQIVVNTCTVKINYPHNSTHVPGAVNVTGTMECSPLPVSASYLSVYLYYNGVMYGYGQNYAYNVTFNTANAATSCQAGSYFGQMDYTVYFGQNWNPPTATGTLISPTLPITC